MLRPSRVLVALACLAAAGCAEGAGHEMHTAHPAAMQQPTVPAAPSVPATPSVPSVPAAPEVSAPTVAAPASHVFTKLSAPSATYPLKTCVVSGEPMGAPVAYSYDGTEVQFCCPDCVKEFQENPEKYLAQIRAAAK